MPEAAFYGYWQLGYLLGAMVVLAVATLLIGILLVARKIEALATSALGIAGHIESRTRPIWLLGEANRVVTRILAAVTRVEATTDTIAGVVKRAREQKLGETP